MFGEIGRHESFKIFSSKNKKGIGSIPIASTFFLSNREVFFLNFMIKPKQTELKPNTNKFFIFSQKIKQPFKKKRRLKKIKKLQIKRIQFLLAINSYRGVRLKKGLPARGQRTRTNAVSCLKKIKLYDTQKFSKIIPRRKNF